jgi:hypothetical protein
VSSTFKSNRLTTLKCSKALLPQIEEAKTTTSEGQVTLRVDHLPEMLLEDRFKTNQVPTQQSKVSYVTMFFAKTMRLLFLICQVKKKP